MEVDLVKAHELAEAALYPLPREPVQVGCVDGRYETRIPLRRPGGNAGEVLDAFRCLRELHATFDPMACWDAVMAVVGGEEKFHYHSDYNTLCIFGGCGHMAAIRQDPTDYGLQKEDVDFVCGQLRQLRAKGIMPVRLSGQHHEEAVFVVESETHAMSSQALDMRFFVYHRTLNGLRICKIAEQLYRRVHPANPRITRNQVSSTLKKAGNENLRMTLQKLALTLPRFRATIGEYGFTVEPILVF